MKRKNLIYMILPLLTTAFMLSGCDSLEMDTKATVGADTYYSDAATLEPALVGIYARLARGTWDINQLACYEGADDLTTHTTGNKAPVLEGDQFSRTDGNTWVSTFYNEYYTTILNCNSFIEGASKREGFIEESVLNNALANARFIRGLVYFRLATCFKDVPMPLTADVDLTISKTPYREVMAQVILDMQYAEKWLVNARDLTPTTADAHATKTAAKAMLAKTYMQLTGYPTNETALWSEVKRLSKEIIDANVYTLKNDFAACFQNPTQVNNEMIFAHFATKGVWPTQCESRYYGFKWCDWADTFMEHKYYDNFPAGYRKKFSAIGAPDLVNTDAITVYFNKWVTTFHHPFVSKFSYGTIKGQPGFESGWQTSNDCPVIRTSEVYLMYAEACTRVTPADYTEAKLYLNYVKRRAYAKNSTTQAAVLALADKFWQSAEPAVDYAGTDAGIVDAILTERAYEFLGEINGNRWLDLVRLEKVGEVNQYRVGKSTEIDEVPLLGDPNDKTQWWTPIPGTETVLNPNLK